MLDELIPVRGGELVAPSYELMSHFWQQILSILLNQWGKFRRSVVKQCII